MIRMLPVTLAGIVLAPAAPDTLAVRREVDSALTVTAETEWELETTSFSMTMDGEPIDRPGGAGGMGVVMTRKVEYLDQVLEAADGVPSRLRREFTTVEGELEFGESSQTQDSPFAGLVLELAREDDEVSVEVVDGSEPDAEGALDGHRLELSLEALLAEGELELGAQWEFDGELLARALGVDLEAALFPRPEPEEGERGGRRRGGRGGSGLGSWFTQGEWEGTAELVSDDEDFEGATCYRIKLEARVSGELPEPQGGGGGGRGGRALDLSSHVGPALALENTFEAELEGELDFDPALGLPVRLVVEVDYSETSRRERDRQGSLMVIETERAGTLHHVVEVRAVVEDAEDAE